MAPLSLAALEQLRAFRDELYAICEPAGFEAQLRALAEALCLLPDPPAWALEDREEFGAWSPPAPGALAQYMEELAIEELTQWAAVGRTMTSATKVQADTTINALHTLAEIAREAGR
jgi:hypothetical protein